MASTNFFTHISEALPVNIVCLTFVVLVTMVSQAGLYLFDLYFERKKIAQNNEVVGIIFGAICGIYSLILAFVILAVWGDFEDLEKTIATEADKLNGILAHSATLPDQVQQPIRTALMSYCNQVVDKEWNMEAAEFTRHPSAIPELRLMLLQLEPQRKSEESIYAVLDEDLSCISDLRRTRLSYNHSRVPDLVWFILQAGSTMLIVFYYFLTIPSATLRKIYLSFLASYIAMCMFLVHTLDRPFTGQAQVSKEPFQNILAILDEISTITQK